MNKVAKQQKLQSQKEPSKANGLQITKTRSKSPFVFGTKPRRKSPDCCLWIRQACLPKSINNSQVRHRNNLTCQIVPVPKREALRLLRHRGAQCFCAAERRAFAPSRSAKAFVPQSAELFRRREARFSRSQNKRGGVWSSGFVRLGIGFDFARQKQAQAFMSAGVSSLPSRNKCIAP